MTLSGVQGFLPLSSPDEIRQIQAVDAYPFILGIHYARRLPCIQYAFGLFEAGELVGVVTFGQPASPSLCVGVCGSKYRNNVIELNRLVILPGKEKCNRASKLVGGGMKLLPKGLIVVSYADYGQWGHIGYVYQATNFIYTGMTKERTDIFSEGGHSRHYVPGETRRQPRSAKHRYVFFTDKRMRKLLRYEQLPYPKGDSRKYDTANPTPVQG